MSNLNLGNLKNNRDEILKAEIGALLFNLGKTHAGIGNWKQYFPEVNSLFGGYKKYYEDNNFENELAGANFKLKDFIFNKKVKLPDNSELDWKDFFYGDASSHELMTIVFFRGCENINSGIDKGSPIIQLDKLWISNAFGSFKRVVEEKYFDKTRLYFFNRFHRYLEDKNYYSNPEWQKIRDWIFNEVKSWYLRLLSDSRFPVNDVTLFDQAYMTASMFKAVLAGLFLESSKYSNYLNNPQSIKWSIFGIQYDKLGLAEKGLKVASIKWYRDKSQETDNQIKSMIEIEYALGNEVYRDETGIYFVVAENVKGDKNGDFYDLNSSLDDIKSKIQEIFSNNFEGEVYPAILLTEPSRGLMNLGHLIEKAKENFLKVEYPEDFKEKLKHDLEPNGICQICKMRLAHKGDKENLICDVCNERLKGRVKKWIEESKKETIWLDELQDKNGRIALVTLKFELEKWLNGDLVNSLVVRDENFKNYLSDIEKIFNKIKKITKFNLLKNFNNSNEINNFINLFDKNGIQKPFESVLKDKILRKILTKQLNNLNDREKGLKNLFFRSLDYTLMILEKSINDWISYIDSYFSISSKFDITNKSFKNQNIFRNINLISFIKDSFSFGFIVMQIYNILFERSIGSQWEDFIYKELNDWYNSNNKPLKQKIDFDDRKIYWENLNDNDIKFLSQILLQFLLRKNPSPARLRRIWETTREFLEYLESKLMDNKLIILPEERRKRIVITLRDGSRYKDKEYKYGELFFWKNGNEIRTITSIEKVAYSIGKELEIFGKSNLNVSEESDIKKWLTGKIKKIESYNKNENDTIEFDTENVGNIQIENYQPSFTILKPTPISWQFIIPAESLPQLIENVQKEYYKNFKWVYGKLPLHIGTVVQNYKKPLYIGINALRKIRRDDIKWEELGKEISVQTFKARQKEAFHYQENFENTEWCENFYSLFEKCGNEGKYEFFLYPEKMKKVWLDTTQHSVDTDKFEIYPNTIDFEFLDTNTRRNDIYYNESGKRFLKLKRLRPYDLHNWQYFKRFKEFFLKDKKSSSKLQKLISLIHTKMEDWQDGDALKQFMISSFINIMELKKDKDEFAGIFGVNEFGKLQSMNAEMFKEKLLMLIDMFEFWHTMLKY